MAFCDETKLPTYEVVNSDGSPKRPPGRPLGSKNKETILSEIVANHLEPLFKDKMLGVAEKTFEKALEGDSTCLKILWDRVMPVKKAIDNEGKGAPLVNITIKGIEPEIIEGEIDE